MNRLSGIRLRYFSLLTLLSVFGALILFNACTDDLELPTPAPDSDDFGLANYISIKIECSEPSTRATEPGVEELNENLIEDVTICLAPSAGDRTDEDQPVYMETFPAINLQNEAVVRIPMTMELMTRLFNENSSGSCRVFAAVNLHLDPGTVMTVAELRKMVINSTFETQRIQKSFKMDGDGTVSYSPNGNYAVGEVAVKRSAAKITLALDVDGSVEEEVEGQTYTWIPDRNGIGVRLEQGVKTSTLDPRPEPNMASSVYFNTADEIAPQYKFVANKADQKYNIVQDVPFYTYPNKWTGSVDEKHGTFLMLSVPWSKDGGKSWRTCYYHVPIVPTNEFELVRNISYHINLHVGVLGSFVVEDAQEIEADYFVADWGHENIDVDIKGYRYLVVDQNDYTVNNENEIVIPFYTSHKSKVVSTTMTFYRYNFSDQGSEFAVTVTDDENDLSAEKNNGVRVFESDFINVDENHKEAQLVVKHDLVVWQPYRANGNEVKLTEGADGVREDIDKPSAIEAMLNTIAYYKPTTEDEYSAIKFEVIVQHTDVADGSSGLPKDSYQEKITIWQFPGMYITAVQNFSDYLEQKHLANAKLGNTFINGVTTDNITAPKMTWSSDQQNNYFGWGELGWYGNYVNNYNSSGEPNRAASYTDTWNTARKRAYNYTNWDCSIGLGFPPSYYNWNPNLYLVTITKLNDENYNIGDPRSYNINNNLKNSSGSYTVDGGTETVFASEYWYYQVGKNNLGPESSSSWNSVFYGQKNPLNKRASVSITWWDEYIVQGFVSAKSNYGANPRTLKYYYPTREASDNSNTLAPKFRICSSYAGSRGYMTREMSRRRAAAYQELGYCAGRWRLPTYGEVKFIMKLAGDKKIPRLFGTNASGTWYYWCAQGLVEVPAGNAPNTNPNLMTTPPNDQGSAFKDDYYKARTRFVYDEWYWGSETIKPDNATPSATETMYTFTWGDRPKSNPQD